MNRILKLKMIVVLVTLSFNLNAQSSNFSFKLDSVCSKLIPSFESFRLNNRLFVLNVVSLDTISGILDFSLSAIYNENEYLRLNRVAYTRIDNDTIILINNDNKVLNYKSINADLDVKFQKKLLKAPKSVWDGYIISEGSTYVVEFKKGSMYKKFYINNALVPEKYQFDKLNFHYKIDSTRIQH